MIGHQNILRFARLSALYVGIGLVAGAARADTIWLSALDLAKARVTDKVRPGIGKTIEGKALTINKKMYDRGICVNGYTLLYVQLNGGCDKLTAIVGVDDESAVGVPPAPAGANAAGRGGAGQGAGGRGGASVPSMSLRILADGNRVLYENNNVPFGITGKQLLRDLWRQKDIGKFSDEYSAELPRHGCLLLKISATK